MSLQELEKRLDDLGRRISFSGLSKMERGQKRIELDDLMALSIALDVSPLAILLPVGDPGVLVEVTGARGDLGLFWTWAMAEGTPFSRDDRSFIARSIPWWVETQTSIDWHGDLELAIAKHGEELRPVQSIHYAARFPEDVGSDRAPGRDADNGEH